MKTIYWKTILSVVALAALCGCGPSYTFSPWVGEQQNWQTGPGGYVRLVNGTTIYPPGQLPNRPYIILGSVQADSEDGIADAIKSQHADAALLSTEQTFHNGSVTVVGGGVAWSQPLRRTVLTANLIKFR